VPLAVGQSPRVKTPDSATCSAYPPKASELELIGLRRSAFVAA
jgi:hypothetical protein